MPSIEYNPIIPQGLRVHNVCLSNFEWQILGLVNQISIFCKLGSCRVTRWYTYYIFQSPKFQCEKYLKNYLGNVVVL